MAGLRRLSLRQNLLVDAAPLASLAGAAGTTLLCLANCSLFAKYNWHNTFLLHSGLIAALEELVLHTNLLTQVKIPSWNPLKGSWLENTDVIKGNWLGYLTKILCGNPNVDWDWTFQIRPREVMLIRPWKYTMFCVCRYSGPSFAGLCCSADSWSLFQWDQDDGPFGKLHLQQAQGALLGKQQDNHHSGESFLLTISMILT